MSNWRCVRFVYIFIIHFKNRCTKCKQCRPWSDATFCGIWSGSTLFANVPFYGAPVINWLILVQNVNIALLIFLVSTCMRIYVFIADGRIQDLIGIVSQRARIDKDDIYHSETLHFFRFDSFHIFAFPYWELHLSDETKWFSFRGSFHMSQHTTKPTIRLMRPAKTRIRLRGCAVWSESSLVAYAFHSLWAIQRRINENPCHTGWMYRLICALLVTQVLL